ncbi:JmjC domain, hydroxylase-domain-containing protein [Hyaloraphidium curvatum]|nr:JmjC domain, hydroxylase-domain-containing protein [Hyaloraphidium curvatum]
MPGRTSRYREDVPFKPQFYPPSYDLKQAEARSRVFGIEHVPVLRPTVEQFNDPLSYIESLREIGERYGAVKIVPPPGWSPPCAIDPEKFRVATRLQRLNQMNGRTRSTVNYMESLMTFHEQQGQVFTDLPSINQRPIDLFKLKKEVAGMGGFDAVTQDKRWGDIGAKLGFNHSHAPSLANQVKTAYRKWILPFEEHIQRSLANAARKKKAAEQQRSQRRERRARDDDSDTEQPADSAKGQSVEGTLCSVCEEACVETGAARDDTITCDCCSGVYHIACLDPPPKVWRQDWFCAKCLADSVENFGFEDGGEYSLLEFAHTANRWKEHYFDMDLPGGGPAGVSEDDVEREFWRLVEDPYNEVEVEYGADLHATIHGSAFPTLDKQPDSPYASHPFNLNNLPTIAPSLLSHLNVNISGMMVPWVYVGHCFSTFCWHVEDHWAYAVNYVHLGETKTWYIVPEWGADMFEAAMRRAVPELFEKTPDLLFHLTTMLSPQFLKKEGVPVYAIDQRAGEFTVTWPRAYHCGFNHGFNVAEAVNFAPPDWLPAGRKCVERYRDYQRTPVFCHDELVIRVALKDSQASGMDKATFKYLQAELQAVLKKEVALRKIVQQCYPDVHSEEDNPWDSTSAAVRKKSTDDDEAIRCHECRSYVYLSYVVCGKGQRCPSSAGTAPVTAVKKEGDDQKESKPRYGAGRVGLVSADQMASQRKVCLSCIDKVQFVLASSSLSC